MTTNDNNKKSNPKRIERTAKIEWVAIEGMRVSPRAQREQRKSHIQNIAANFDPNKFGLPTINVRDGINWIVDGGHRVEGMRLMGWGDQQIQCFVHVGLTEQEEAEMFLVLNNINPVSAMDRFKVSVVADRIAEVDIDMVVSSLDMRVGQGMGAISAVGSLHRVYTNIGPDGLHSTLQIIRDAYGDHGYKAPIIDGIALVIGRYGNLDHDQLLNRLSGVRGGIAGLTNKAAVLREKTGEPKRSCMAAAAVDIYNMGKGKKITPWFKAQA